MLTSANTRSGVDHAQRWREDFTLRLATINGLPGVIVEGAEGPVQTAAFEIEHDRMRALYVVRNPDKLRQVAAAPLRHDSSRMTGGF